MVSFVQRWKEYRWPGRYRRSHPFFHVFENIRSHCTSIEGPLFGAQFSEYIQVEASPFADYYQLLLNPCVTYPHAHGVPQRRCMGSPLGSLTLISCGSTLRARLTSACVLQATILLASFDTHCVTYTQSAEHIATTEKLWSMPIFEQRSRRSIIWQMTIELMPL